jgi:hypothetical protein
MRAPRRFGAKFPLYFSAPLLAFPLFLALTAPSALQAQQTEQPPAEEFVANLAAGRVVIAVVKDAIVIVTVENPIEVQTHVPAPVPVSALRAEILLGAIDWQSPSSQQQIARIDRELPHLRTSVLAGPKTNSAPTLGGATANAEAVDLEGVGQALFERFNDITRDIHGKISLPAGEPIAQLVVLGYARDYGPEVWLLTFDVQQDIQREDYYSTHVTRPTFAQYWPPEKGQPHTLIEFQYPPENPSPTILELLRNKDPRLDKIMSSDAKMSQVASLLLAGDSKKILGVDAVQFFRAVLGAISTEKTRETVSTITEDGGLQWVLQPPAEPKAPVSTAQKEHPAEAPSLLHNN